MSYSYVDEYVTPACAGNSLHGADVLCQAAATDCASEEHIRFWIWHRTVEVVVGPPRVVTEGAWDQLAGTFCLGPDDPGVPTIARVVAAVRQQFASQRFPIPASTVRAQPGPTTLVNFETWFHASSAPVETINTVILGTAVHITPVATTYRWEFGDGATQEGPEAGRPGSADVAHTYTALGPKVVTVTVTYGGTFRLGTSPTEYDMRTPAVVVGIPSTLQVRQARAELVSR